MGSLPSVDRYILESEIGRGGFGAVYRARHAVLDRKVALKVLHPQRQSSGNVLQRFLREAKSVAQLGSPYIVQVLDADMTADGLAFIAMELLEGEDLASRLTRAGRIPTLRAVRLGREVLAGLAVAHAQQIVHRDLKPGNLFLARDASGTEVAKILDFGISKVRTEDPADELTRTGTMLGTPHYMAPEQFTASRSVDGRADLYSLGTVLFEALTGRLPFEASTLEQLIAAKLSEPPRSLADLAPDVPRAVSDVVMRALADDPKARYQSAAEMDAALAKVESTTSTPGVVLPRSPSERPIVTALAGGPTLVAGTPTTMVAPRPSRAVPLVAGIAGLLLIFAFTMLAMTIAGVWLAERELGEWLHPGPRSSRTSASPIAPTPSAPTPRAPTPSAAPPIWPSPTAPPTTPQPTWPTPVWPDPTTTAPMTPPSIGASPSPSPPLSAADVRGVRVVVSAMGRADQAALDAAAERALPALARCRGQSGYREQITFGVMTGGRLHDGQRITATPSATRDCVVDAIIGAGPVDPTPGLARFTVTLDPTG